METIEGESTEKFSCGNSSSKGGYDYVVDFVGSSSSINSLVTLVRPGGIFELAFPQDTLKLNVESIVRNEIRFIGLHGYQGSENLKENDFYSVIDCLAIAQLMFMT